VLDERASDGPERGPGPWIWGASTDLLAFGGSAAVAVALAACSSRIAHSGALPPWLFLLLVVGVDVAHVWSTLFRTYLDPEELARRRLLYAGVPLACFAIGVGLMRLGPLAFWRVLAYLALAHFVRQQIGWVAVYRARARLTGALDRWLDDAAIYLATLYPVVDWHARAPRPFDWFVSGDFVPLAELAVALPFVRVAWALALLAYAARAVALAFTRGAFLVGKHLVVATTALSWHVAIVSSDADLPFTAANVLPHGVPYLVLLWRFARARASELGAREAAALAPRPPSLYVRFVAFGALAFVGLVVGLGWVEELLWDRLVWHEHPSLFGGADEWHLPDRVLALVVPLLALPQATHYVLDAVLWRRGAGGSAAARALGFAPAHAVREAPRVS
jgi:hypothetical protein